MDWNLIDVNLITLEYRERPTLVWRLQGWKISTERPTLVWRLQGWNRSFQDPDLLIAVALLYRDNLVAVDKQNFMYPNLARYDDTSHLEMKNFINKETLMLTYLSRLPPSTLLRDNRIRAWKCTLFESMIVKKKVKVMSCNVIDWVIGRRTIW